MALTKVSYIDDQKLELGTGDDLQIYHDGSHSYIKDTGTGELRLASNQFTVQNAASNETLLYAVENAAVGLKFDDNLKLETTSEGALVSGALGINGQNTTHAANTLKIGHEGSGVHQLRAYGPDGSNNGKIQFNSSRSDGTNPKSITYSSGNLEFPDTQKIRMGNGEDLQIYHDGTDNIISNSGTTLAIHRATENADNAVFEVRSNHGATNQVKFKVDGDGDVLIPTDTGKLQLGVGSDLEIYHDGSNSYVSDAGTGNLKLTSNGTAVQIEKSDGENMAAFKTDGAVELYYDGGTYSTPKLETTASGVKVTGIAFVSNSSSDTNHTNNSLPASVSGLYTINNDGTTGTFSSLSVVAIGSTNDQSASFIAKSVSSGHSPEVYITQRDGANSQRNVISINTSGNVGINQTNPQYQFDVNGSIHSGGDATFAGNVGIGEAPDASYALDIKNGTAARVAFDVSTGSDATIIMDGINADFAGSDYWSLKAQSSGEWAIFKAGSEKFRIDTDSSATFAGSVSDSKGNVRTVPLNINSSAYTLVAGDAGKCVTNTTGGWTVNNNIFTAGQVVTFINNSGSAQTITQGSGVTIYNTADAATGNRTLAARGMATLIFYNASSGYISGAGLT